jgi:hypothetical protein
MFDAPSSPNIISFRLHLDVDIGGYDIESGSIPNQPWY